MYGLLVTSLPLYLWLIMNDLRFVIFSIVIYYDTKIGLNTILCKYFARINTTLTKNLVLRRKAEKSPAKRARLRRRNADAELKLDLFDLPIKICIAVVI